MKRKPQQEATGAIAVPTPVDHRTSYPGVSASKNIMVAAIPIFQTARAAKPHENPRNEPETRVFAQEFDCFIAVAAPRAVF